MSESPHTAWYVKQVVKNRVWRNILPGLAKEPKGQGLFMMLLILMGAMGAAFTGYYIDTQVLNPPLQLFGICPPPAKIGNVGGFYGVGTSAACFTETIQKNPDGTTTTIRTPAGYFEFLNGTRYQR